MHAQQCPAKGRLIRGDHLDERTLAKAQKPDHETHKKPIHRFNVTCTPSPPKAFLMHIFKEAIPCRKRRLQAVDRPSKSLGSQTAS